MTFPSFPIIGGYGIDAHGAGLLVPVDERKPEKPALGPAEGTTDQTGGVVGGGLGFLSGYGPRPCGCPTTWLDCLNDPVLAAARAYALNPIRVNKWRCTARDDAPAGAKEFIENVTRPHIAPYLEDAVWGVDLGNAGWQIDWRREDGHHVINRLLPYQPEIGNSGILIGKASGYPAGILWEGVELYGFKGFSYTYDRRGRDWRGRSRIENVIDSIHQWRKANDTTAKLGCKASGIVVGIGYPPGEGKDASGQAVPRYKQADAFGRTLTSGAGWYTYPKLGGITENLLQTLLNRPSGPADLAAILKMSLWDTTPLDLGDPGPSIQAMTEEKRYLDELKCLGYFVPPEAVLQGAGGNRAKSESQGNSGTAMNEPVNVGTVTAFNQGPVDYLLELRYGAKAKGSVWYEAEPLEDSQGVFDREVLRTFAQSEEGLKYLVKVFDIDAIAIRNGLSPRPEPKEGERVPEKPDKSQFEAAKAARDAGASERETLRVAGYDNAMVERILGERALEDVESMMAAKPRGEKQDGVTRAA